MTDTTRLDHLANAAAVTAFQRDEVNPLLSAETVPEDTSLMDLAAFAKECPDRFFELLSHLRPEFFELIVEYYVLHKSQSFLAKVQGCIQTRIWQKLRIAEQAIGALIVLGTEPSADALRTILQETGLEDTEYGPLSEMIAAYALTQSYADVAKQFAAPIPAIRKIFRPSIERLTASKNLKEVAVGSYLRNLVYNASLTKSGLSKRCLARMQRTQTFRFDAPSSDESPLIAYGVVEDLLSTPWSMFEISSENRMVRVLPLIRKYGKRLFGKHAAQIFAPLDTDGELKLGYILARSTNPTLTRALTRIRGISDMASRYTDSGSFICPILVPNVEVQQMIDAYSTQKSTHVRVGMFVRISTGLASGYCGTITQITKKGVQVRVDFPSGRQFTVDASCNSVVQLRVPKTKQQFWGTAV